jgi:hypothetical protein
VAKLSPRQCDGKRVYWSETDAAVAASRRKEKGVPYLRSYQCKLCGFHHLTSKPLLLPAK